MAMLTKRQMVVIMCELKNIGVAHHEYADMFMRIQNELVQEDILRQFVVAYEKWAEGHVEVLIGEKRKKA